MAIVVIQPPAGPPGPQGPAGPVGPPGPDTVEAIQEHIDDPEPHTAYDIDMPSLTLIFENQLI